jgi:glycosyltransferase involved in cell wall biosynthesis
VPTIGSLAGGIPELVVNGSTGYLSPIGDTDSMAEGAVRLLTDDSLYANFREACLHRARTEFCNDRVTAQYEKIYYEVLGIDKEVPMPLCQV